MRGLFKIFFSATLPFLLSGCMALALAPVANAAFDKPAAAEYKTVAKKQAVFNAALKSVSAKGTATVVDRETGMIRGDISTAMGQTGYNVVISVDERPGFTFLRVNAKLEGIIKFEFQGSSQLMKDIVDDIERQIGTKLERI